MARVRLFYVTSGMKGFIFPVGYSNLLFQRCGCVSDSIDCTSSVSHLQHILQFERSAVSNFIHSYLVVCVYSSVV